MSASQYYVLSLTNFITFEFTLAPDASQEDQAYVEKWKYIIQLR